LTVDKIIMRCLVFLIAFAALLAVSFADDACLVSKNCTSCLSSPGCGWCSVSAQCLTGTAGGPSSSHCAPGWRYGAPNVTCTNCTAVRACHSCSIEDECYWCSDTKSCHNNAEAVPCKAAHTCPCEEPAFDRCRACLAQGHCQWCRNGGLQNGGKCADRTATCNGTVAVDCPCSENDDCESCKKDYGCTWCDDTRKCEDPEHRNATCLSPQFCPFNVPKKSGFNAGSFVGGIFLGAGLLAIAIGGVFFWMKKKQQVSYQAM